MSVERIGKKLELLVQGVAYVGQFHVLFSKFSLGSFGACCKISHVKKDFQKATLATAF